MEMRLSFKTLSAQAELISIWKVVHQDSFWNRAEAIRKWSIIFHSIFIFFLFSQFFISNSSCQIQGAAYLRVFGSNQLAANSRSFPRNGHSPPNRLDVLNRTSISYFGCAPPPALPTWNAFFVFPCLFLNRVICAPSYLFASLTFL